MWHADTAADLVPLIRSGDFATLRRELEPGARRNGSAEFGYGSFKRPSGELNVGGRSHSVGDFLSVSGMRTDRFLDPPEFTALHGQGNAVSFFNRLDAHAGDTSTFT